MNKINNALTELYHIENKSNEDTWLNRLHPLSKLFLTVIYITLVVSFPKYDVIGLMGMSVYIIIVFLIGDIPFWECMRRVRYILSVVLIMGICNPFFDRSTVMTIGTFVITGGMVSMMTLIIKGIFTVLAAYLLILSTNIEKIADTLMKIHVPQILVTVILLTYHYLGVLLEEALKITQAYELRAPKQKGIHFKAWGTLIGQLLLRSMDRASNVYESMSLRGYGMGNPHYSTEKTVQLSDILWFLVWTSVLIFIRKVPIFILVGNLFIQ